MTYLKEIVFVSIICGMLSRLAPSSKSGVGKFVKLAASLVFLCVILQPFVGDLRDIPELVKEITDVPYTKEDIYQGSIDVVSSEICKAAAKAAADHFSVSQDCFGIKLIIDKSVSGNYSIKEATVYPSGDAAMINGEVLKQYFIKILSCTVEVVTDG